MTPLLLPTQSVYLPGQEVLVEGFTTGRYTLGEDP